jgi:hypothetical protein
MTSTPPSEHHSAVARRMLGETVPTPPGQTEEHVHTRPLATVDTSKPDRVDAVAEQRDIDPELGDATTPPAPRL